MNPLTNVRNIAKLNDQELKLGIFDANKSWHAEYKDSAYIFTGGLPYDLTEGDILCVFSQYGEIVNINLVRDKKTGKSKGYSFLAYQDQKSTILAVDNLNGTKLGGRTIRVDHVQDYRRPKGDEKDESGKFKVKLETGCAPKPLIQPSSSTENKDASENVERLSKKKKKGKRRHKSDSESCSESEDEIKKKSKKKLKTDADKIGSSGIRIKKEFDNEKYQEEIKMKDNDSESSSESEDESKKNSKKKLKMDVHKIRSSDIRIKKEFDNKKYRKYQEEINMKDNNPKDDYNKKYHMDDLRRDRKQKDQYKKARGVDGEGKADKVYYEKASSNDYERKVDEDYTGRSREHRDSKDQLDRYSHSREKDYHKNRHSKTKK